MNVRIVWILCLIAQHKKNKATRSPGISRQQVQKLTPQFLLYIYIGYRFPLSLSTIWGNDIRVNFMLKFPTCISTIWKTTSYLTSKWRGTFQYFQSHVKIPYIYYLEKPPPIEPVSEGALFNISSIKNIKWEIIVFLKKKMCIPKYIFFLKML